MLRPGHPPDWMCSDEGITWGLEGAGTIALTMTSDISHSSKEQKEKAKLRQAAPVRTTLGTMQRSTRGHAEAPPGRVSAHRTTRVRN